MWQHKHDGNSAANVDIADKNYSELSQLNAYTINAWSYQIYFGYNKLFIPFNKVFRIQRIFSTFPRNFSL